MNFFQNRIDIGGQIEPQRQTPGARAYRVERSAAGGEEMPLPARELA